MARGFITHEVTDDAGKGPSHPASKGFDSIKTLLIGGNDGAAGGRSFLSTNNGSSSPKHTENMNVTWQSSSSEQQKMFRELFANRSNSDASLVFVEPTTIENSKVAWIPKDMAEKGIKLWERTLVGSFLDKKVYFPALKQALHRIWKPKGNLEMYSTEEGFFMLRFSLKEDRDKILAQGLWHVFNKPFFLAMWVLGFNFEKDVFDKMPIWKNCQSYPRNS